MSEINDILNPALANYSLADIARLAGVHPNQMSNLRSGRRQPSRVTLNKIKFAISRLDSNQTEGSLELTALYRVALALSCCAMGLDAASVQDSEPAAKRAANREWRDASFARWVAQALLNTGLGFKQAEVARAAGVTRQAVSLAMREIELKRDDPAFEAMLLQLERSIVGARDAQ